MLKLIQQKIVFLETKYLTTNGGLYKTLKTLVLNLEIWKYTLSLFTTVSGPHPCWWRVSYQRGLPRLVLPLGRDGVTITSFSSIHLVRTRPALY